MFRKHCGTKISDSANFCRNCGAKVGKASLPYQNQNLEGEDVYNSGSPYQGTSNVQPPGSRNTTKRWGSLRLLVIFLAIAVVAGVGVNMFQFFNGTHAFLGNSSNGGCAYATLKIYELVSGIYAVKGSWDSDMLHGNGPEPLTDWQVRVVQSDSNMTITFLNDSGTILTGTYDEIKGVFVGKDENTGGDFFESTWWMQEDTTIQFDFNSNPMTAKGFLFWDWAQQVAEMERSEDEAIAALWNWTKVDFSMTKIGELP